MQEVQQVQIEQVSAIAATTFAFFVLLLNTLVVERVIEILVAVFNYVERKRSSYARWNQRALELRKRWDRLRTAQHGVSPIAFPLLFWKIVKGAPHPGGRESISAEAIRLLYLRVGITVVSLALASCLVWIQELNFVNLIENLLFETVGLEWDLAPWAGFIITAIIISIGTEPLHQLITRIERIGERRRRSQQEVT